MAEKQVKTGVIIVAGGSGSRMGADIPKQFLLLCGRPILMRCVERFGVALPEAEIVVVLPTDELERWAELCRTYECFVPHKVCKGGENRFYSVKAGLEQIADADLVAVHDGVRPLLSAEMIRDTVKVAQRTGSAIPVTEAVDSFRKIDKSGSSKAIDRSTLRAVQTPQVFAYQTLKNAYCQSYNRAFTDDASVVEKSGVKVTICPGERSNIKITTPLDLIIAEVILNNPQ